MQKLVTYLEMTTPDQVRPARSIDGLDVVRICNAELHTDRISRLHDGIATPHLWSSLHNDWSSERARQMLTAPGRSDWIAVADDRDVGWGALVVADGDVELATFGLRPVALGRGYGGAFLTELLRTAWQKASPGGRVWLRTSSWDHPNAIRNYLARGFEVARLELVDQTTPTDRIATPVDAAPRFLARPAGPMDTAGVADLLAALGYPLPEATIRERLARLSTSRDDLVAVVAENDEQIVGVASAHVIPRFGETSHGFVRITALSVAHDSQRHGIGRKLVDFIEYFARTRDCDAIEVTSGQRPERAGAHCFYPALGFVDTSDVAVRYWKDLEDH